MRQWQQLLHKCVRVCVCVWCYRQAIAELLVTGEEVDAQVLHCIKARMLLLVRLHKVLNLCHAELAHAAAASNGLMSERQRERRTWVSGTSQFLPKQAVARRNLVAVSQTNLRRREGHAAAIVVVQVLKVHKDALCGLRAQEACCGVVAEGGEPKVTAVSTWQHSAAAARRGRGGGADLACRRWGQCGWRT